MIEVLLFAHLREAVGEEKLNIPCTNQAISDVKEWLEERYPQLSLKQVMSAVNEEFARDETVLNEGDTLAFIPPISGG